MQLAIFLPQAVVEYILVIFQLVLFVFWYTIYFTFCQTRMFSDDFFLFYISFFAAFFVNFLEEGLAPSRCFYVWNGAQNCFVLIFYVSCHVACVTAVMSGREQTTARQNSLDRD